MILSSLSFDQEDQGFQDLDVINDYFLQGRLQRWYHDSWTKREISDVQKRKSQRARVQIKIHFHIQNYYRRNCFKKVTCYYLKSFLGAQTKHDFIQTSSNAQDIIALNGGTVRKSTMTLLQSNDRTTTVIHEVNIPKLNQNSIYIYIYIWNFRNVVLTLDPTWKFHSLEIQTNE